MNIGINAHLLSLDESYRAAGVSNYIAKLASALNELDTQHRFTLYVGSQSAHANRELELGANFRTVASRFPTHLPPVRIFWEQTVLPFLSLRQDVLLCPVNVVPLVCRARRVLTIHDLAFMKFADKHLPAKRNYLSIMTKLSAQRADAIITDAECTKTDVIELLGIPAERITVIPLAANPSYTDLRQTSEGRARIQAVRQRHSLPERFLLYIGTLEPRKNIPALLHAYADFCRQQPDAPLLVIAGAKGWMYENIFRLTQNLALADRIVFPGFVPRDEMNEWYCAAIGFVYLSEFEGFGLPPLEAMACGTPVIVNDASSLPEVVGNAGVKVQAAQVEQVSRAMQQIVNDVEKWNTLSQAGMARAAEFSWQTTAQKTREVIQRVLR
jgi:glycosyltransferase involved in cell wall biosynthesis